MLFLRVSSEASPIAHPHPQSTASPIRRAARTPIATVCAIATAAQSQVLIKAGGQALYQLAKLDVLAMDKTGTLTQGHFRVTGIHSARELPKLLSKVISGAFLGVRLAFSQQGFSDRLFVLPSSHFTVQPKQIAIH